MITVRTSPAYVNRVRQDWTANGGVYGDGGVYAVVPSNDPFAQLGPTLDLTFAGVPTNQLTAATADGYSINLNLSSEIYQIAAQYAVWVDGSGMTQRNFADIVTFSRTSGATWFNSAGVNVGIDFSTSSVAIGTGSKTFTLTATAGVDRSWTAGDIVRISEQATPANFMDGTVTSYTASTQTLVVNVTATGGSGTIASWRVSNWMPRFDYNPSTLAAQGLLIEEQRTNLLTYSALIGGTNWTNQNSIVVTTNTTDVTDPSNTNTASKLVSGSATSQTLQSATLTATVHSASVYLRSLSGTTSVELYVYLTLSPFTVIGSATVTATSTWQRFSFTTSTATAASYTLAIRVPSGTVYAFGAQLEAGAFPTSYIPTTVAQVTRNADVASVNTLSPWYNSAAGTLFAESVSSVPSATLSGAIQPNIVFITDGTSNNRIGMFYNTGNVISGRIVTAGATANPADISANLPSVNRSALAYAVGTNQGAFSVNASAVTTSSPAGLPVVDRMTLGAGAIGIQLNGYLRRIVYYPRRLSNADLQTITA